MLCTIALSNWNRCGTIAPWEASYIEGVSHILSLLELSKMRGFWTVSLILSAITIARSFYGCESFRTQLLKVVGFQLSRNQVFVGSFKRIKKIEDDAYPARSLKRKKHRITV